MKKKRIFLLWLPALLLLLAVGLAVNLPAEPPAPAGAEVGQQLPDFTVRCVDGQEFRLSEQRGKVVVINLWATWCAPCVKELPQFDRLQREHPSDVSVLALHLPPVTADVAEYLNDFSYEIPFAVDEAGSLGPLLNASAVLPQTLILSPDGIVTYNQAGALTYEALVRLTEEAGR